MLLFAQSCLHPPQEVPTAIPSPAATIPPRPTLEASPTPTPAPTASNSDPLPEAEPLGPQNAIFASVSLSGASLNSQGDCLQEYNPQTDRCDGTDAFTAYHTLQRAADAASAGIRVEIRGGTYLDRSWYHNPGFNTGTPVLTIRNSGTQGHPIVFENYLNESVIIDGEACLPSCWYCAEIGLPGTYWNCPLDSDGSPLDSQRQKTLVVLGSYVTLRGSNTAHPLMVKNSRRDGILVSGSRGVSLERISVTRAGLTGGPAASLGIEFLNSPEGIIQECMVYESYAGFGFTYSPDTVISKSFAFHNWFGGGSNNVGNNADGFSTEIGHPDRSLNVRYSFDQNLSLYNGDDGFDGSSSESSRFSRNASVGNGTCPTSDQQCTYFAGNGDGYKVGNGSLELQVLGNISSKNKGHGFDSTGTNAVFANNTAYGNGGRGINVAELTINNLACGNGTRGTYAVPDAANESPSDLISHNFWGPNHNNARSGLNENYNQASGEQLLVNPAGDPLLSLSFGILLDCNANGQVEIGDRACIFDQLQSQFAPVSNSRALNSGLIQPGVHCSTADDNPNVPFPAADLSCLHYRAQPERGAVESVN